MSDSQKIKIGICIVIAQIILLGMTYGFRAVMDHQAEKAGIAGIIMEAGR